MRRNILVGNWKMNLTRDEGLDLVKNVLAKLPKNTITDIVFAPSFISLYKVAKICSDYKKVFVAAQNCHKEAGGAFTGEVSVKMLLSCGVDYVIIGHSERREYFNETSIELRQKLEQSLNNGLSVIYCCGENLKERREYIHFSSVKSQISDTLFHLSPERFKNIIIAYEPIWAIGTGVTATTLQAQEMHSFIRSILSEKYGKSIAHNTSIIYGGSCNAKNAKALFDQDDIDGGLIGGASLRPDSFIQIARLL